MAAVDIEVLLRLPVAVHLRKSTWPVVRSISPVPQFGLGRNYAAHTRFLGAGDGHQSTPARFSGGMIAPGA